MKIILDIPYESSRDSSQISSDLPAATIMLLNYFNTQEDLNMKKLDLF